MKKSIYAFMMAIIMTLVSIAPVSASTGDDIKSLRKKDKTSSCKYKIAQKKKQIKKAKRTKVTPYYARAAKRK